MNILVLSHLYPRPADPSFGIFVHRSVKHLQELGHRVTVLSCVPWSPRILHFNAKWRGYGSPPTKTVWEGVEVYYTRYLRLPGAWFRSFSGLTAYGGMLSLALRLHNDRAFDIIHSNTLLPDGLAGVYLGRKLDLPTVCTVHGIDAVTHPYETPWTLRSSKHVVRRTGQIITVSQALGRVVESLAKPSRPIRVVYNGVDIEEFRETGATVTEQYRQVPSPRPYILFVGRNIYVKGLKDLLVALAQLVGIIEHNLVVVGPTLSEVKRLDPALTELLRDRLIVPGCLAPAEIPAYMQDCEIFVLPSYVEGLPMVVLEAMACGKPVIATEIMGIPEAVINGVTGILIQPGDALGLAEAIQALAGNPARCHEMGNLGRERIAKEFTWKRHALEMVSVYEETIRQQ